MHIIQLDATHCLKKYTIRYEGIHFEYICV